MWRSPDRFAQRGRFIWVEQAAVFQAICDPRRRSVSRHRSPLWQLTPDGRPIIDDPHKGDIELARCQDGVRLQVLPITADQEIAFGSTFHAEDLNFDGYLDFSVVTEYSGTGGDIRSYWVYDPRSGTFLQNEFTEELRCGSVEITSKYGGCRGAAFIDFDPEKREISRRYFGGAIGGCPNTGEGEGERYRVVNNRLILIHKQEFELISRGGAFEYCAVTLSDLVDGTMRVTEVRRFDAERGGVCNDPRRLRGFRSRSRPSKGLLNAS